MAEKKKHSTEHDQLSLALARKRFVIYKEIYGTEGAHTVNVESPYNGLDDTSEIRVFGFDETGFPVTEEEQYEQVKYFPVVNWIGNSMVSSVFYRGKIVNGVKHKGWKALSYVFGMDVDTLKEILQVFLDKGIMKVYCRKFSNVYGMYESYGFHDSKQPWIFDGKSGHKTPVDYDHEEYGMNMFLAKKLKSKWRIKTRRLASALRRRRDRETEAKIG